MRPRFVLFFLCFLIAIAVLFSFRSTIRTHTATTGTDLSSDIRQTSGPASLTRTVVSNLSASTAATSTDTAIIIAKNTDESRAIREKEIVEARNVPVQFYGLVIDQDSNALPGVRVILGVRHNVYELPNSPKAAQLETLTPEQIQKFTNPTTEVVSDANGRFQWTDPNVTGDVLGIGSIAKEGYEPETTHFSSPPSAGSYYNPIIFKMWSTNVHEQLITGEKSFEIQPDGQPHVIDLATGAIADAGDGDLKVWIRYTNQVSQGQLYDWSAGIEVINGGLLEEPSGTVMYVAPTDGYRNSFQLQQQIKGGQSGEIGDRDFYLRLKNGKEYGRLNINLYAPYGYLHPGMIRFSYAINPSGSRILR